MTINWFGSIGAGQGYSGSAEKIVVALEELGHDVRMVGFTKIPDKNLSEAGRRIKYKPFKKGEVAIAYGFPVSFSSIDSWKYRFGFSMFETDKLPTAKNWAGINAGVSCNDLTGLIVPSEHSKKLFSDTGVTCPISVVHLGVDTRLYKFFDRTPKKDFTFLQLGNLSVRKNSGAVISAFLTLFKNNPDVKLIIKTGGYTIPPMDFGVPNIQIINERSTPEEIRDYYNKADCFVFPSRGEGFGLPPLEAMSTGLPTILASNTGMMDYARNEYCYPIIRHEIVPALEFPKEWGDVGNWYDPSYEELKKLMWHVYTHRDEAREKGKLASEIVAKEFTFEKTASLIVQVIQNAYN